MVTRREVIRGAGAAALATAAGCMTTDAPVAGKPAVERPVRFGFITDCHHAPHIVRPGDPRRYGLALAKMRSFARCANRSELDFVVEGGDFKDLGRTPAESLKYLDEMEAAFAGFEGPRYHVLGNHDHDNISKEEFLAHVSNAGQERAKAFYAFTCRGVKFIVLDACYRPDGEPYCRGNFSWKQARIPDEQVAFLKAELASATGPCVPIVHQQLDAEDETCIVNAAEVRALLEASGKVKAVIQGHYHEGSFRDVNGIGYYTLRANVIGDAGKTGGNWAIVEVAADGSVAVYGQNGAPCVQSRPVGWDGKLATRWEPGHYQVHFIYTGRGESMFHIFPDGTSMLVDCGDSMRFHNTPAEVPLLPDLSRRAGEWVARYVARVNPRGHVVNENGLSCGFIARYGKFSLFSAGDFSDGFRRPDGTKGQTEDLLAEAVGPVDVAKLNHHGHHSMYPGLVKALRARVWTACVLDQQHCTDDTMARLADRTLYGGERTLLPEYMPLKRPETKDGRGYLSDVPAVVQAQPCHLVLDVPPGGETYRIHCVSAADESNRLLASFGFFSRG